MGYADLVLNGCIRYYLDKVTANRPKDERE
jgi:hypothetical protein